jgi:DNA-directed RNA polymerase subunit RPC12/RpoP
MKRVRCTHCRKEVEVALKALSIFCPHCRQRLILENFRIRNYRAVREFATCGDVVVEKRGAVAAQVQVGNLLVKGRIQGDVEARGKVEVAKTGDICGDIRAPRLVVRAGGTIRGFCRIGVPADEPADPSAPLS